MDSEAIPHGRLPSNSSHGDESIRRRSLPVSPTSDRSRSKHFSGTSSPAQLSNIHRRGHSVPSQPTGWTISSPTVNDPRVIPVPSSPSSNVRPPISHNDSSYNGSRLQPRTSNFVYPSGHTNPISLTPEDHDASWLAAPRPDRATQFFGIPNTSPANPSRYGQVLFSTMSPSYFPNHSLPEPYHPQTRPTFIGTGHDYETPSPSHLHTIPPESYLSFVLPEDMSLTAGANHWQEGSSPAPYSFSQSSLSLAYPGPYQLSSTASECGSSSSYSSLSNALAGPSRNQYTLQDISDEEVQERVSDEYNDDSSISLFSYSI